MPLAVLTASAPESEEQRAAIMAEATTLAASMREIELAAYALRASERIRELEDQLDRLTAPMPLVMSRSLQLT